MEREKQIEEMVEHIYEYVSKQDSAIVLNYEFGGKHKQGIATELYNAGYRKERQGEWISVEDRLPETDYKNTFDYNVLVYIPKREGCKQSGMFLGKVCKVEGDDGKRNFWNIKTEPCEWTVWGWSYFEHPVVTHWQPLPQPPKMKGADNE